MLCRFHLRRCQADSKQLAFNLQVIRKSSASRSGAMRDHSTLSDMAQDDIFRYFHFVNEEKDK
jgi:hypothetical protein